MIFKTIDDESTLSGQRIVGALQARKIAQQQATAQLQVDIQCLKAYELECQKGTANTEAFNATMRKASAEAQAYAANIKNGTGSAQVYADKQKTLQQSIQNTGTASKVASVGVKALSIAGNMFAGMAISWGISKIIEGITWLAEASERAKEKTEELRNELSQISSDYNSNRQTLVGLKDEYDALTKKIGENDAEVALSADEYERYRDITSQILGITPQLITGWNSEGEAISNKNGLLQQSIDLLDEEYQKSLRNNTTKAKNEEIAAGIIAEREEFDTDPNNTTLNGTKYDLIWDGLRKTLNEYDASNKDIDDYDIAKQLSEYLYPGEKISFSNGIDDGYIHWLMAKIQDNEDYEKLANSFTDENNPIYGWFSEEQIRQMKVNATNYFTEVQRVADEGDQIYQKYRDSLNQNAQSAIYDYDPNGEIFSDEAKAGITEFINSIDYSTIKVPEDFSDMATNLKSIIQEMAQSPEFKTGFDGIFSPPTDDETTKDYVDRVNSSIKTVQEYCEENGITVPIDFTTVTEDTDKLNQKYQNAINEFKDQDLSAYFKENSINDESEIDYWNKVTEGAYDAEEAVRMYEAAKSEAQNGNESGISSLSSYLNQEDFQYTKKSLLDLAKSGELTSNVLSDEEFSDFITKLKDIGISADEAKTEILSLLDATEKLSGASKTISSLENAYKEFQENGYVLAETIESIPDVFRELESYDFQKFENIIGNPENTDLMQQAFNDLVTAYINEQETLADVSEEETSRFIANLKEMGIANAEEVVNSTIAFKNNMNATAQEAESTVQKINEFLVNTTGKATSATNDLTDCTWAEIQALIEAGDKFGYATDKVEEFAMQKIWANRNTIDTSADVTNILAIAKAFGLCAEAITSYQAMEDLYEQGYGGGEGQLQSMRKSLADKIRAEIKDIYSPIPSATYKPPTSSSSSSSSSSKEKEETIETYDWIETLLERIQSRINKLDKTVSSTYRTWSARNNALLKELTEVNEEINAQQKAYDIYMNKANSVGLSEHYKQLVQNGDYSIEDISDDTLKEQISAYESWYDKATACSDAIVDLKDNISNLAMTHFENIFSEYEDSLSGYRHQVEMLETYIDQTEAKGYSVSSNYYRQLISTEELNIEKLQEEYSKLKDSIQLAVDTGRITAYSSSWYDMVDSIRDVQKSIEDSNSALIEYHNTLRDLEWEAFDKLLDKISKIKDESDFLVELMSDKTMFDENGITEEGQATLGLHAVNYNMYLSSADEYTKEIEKINSEIANDPNNNTLIERREELLDLQQQSILAAKDEQQAMKDLISQGYDVFLESLQEIIDKRKEILYQMKDIYDYEKNISQQTKEISKLEKILKAYEGDNSEEAKAKIQQYKVSLEESKEQLKETEFERYIQDTEDMLDALMEDAQEFVDGKLSDIEQIVNEVIDSTNKNASDINDTIKESADDVGYTISNKLANALNSASDGVADLVSNYNDNFLGTMTTLQSTVDDIRNLIANTSNSESQSKDYTSDEETLSTPQDRWTQDTNGKWSYYEGGEQVKDEWTKYDKDDKWYHLGDDGIMNTNQWIKNKSGTWSYVNDTGTAVIGWHKLDWKGQSDWYNFDDEGDMLENKWIDDYFVGKDGKMRTNTWIGHNGKYYWVGADGKWLNKEGWSLNYKPNDGLPIYEYAKGSKRIPEDQVALIGEMGEELYYDKSGGVIGKVGEGDMVFTNEASKRLYEFSQDPEGYMEKLGLSGSLKQFNIGMPSLSEFKMPEVQRVINTNQSVNVGDINLYGVNDPKEFAQQVKSIINNSLARDRQTRNLVKESVLAEPLRRTDRSYFYK